MSKPRVSDEELQREAQRATNTLVGKFPIESWPVFSKYALDLLDARRDLAASEQRVAELEAVAKRLNEKSQAQWWMSRAEGLSSLEYPFRAKNIAIYLASAFRQGTRATIAAQRQKEGE